MLVVLDVLYGNLDNIKVKGDFPMESFLLSAPVFSSFGFHGSIPTIMAVWRFKQKKLKK